MVVEANIPPCDRQFRWISSVTGDPETLSRLNQRMSRYYSQAEERQGYQEMLDGQEEEAPPLESVRHQMPKYICDRQPESILEVGCASGRLYRQLRSYGYQGKYTGIEVADYIIQTNATQHPEATWQCATAYEIPFADASFDLCFSLYVLEHLIYPQVGLKEMMRVVKPGGKLVLVFPDFVAAGLFSSQFMGLSPVGHTSEKLKAGKIIDALISIYDSRIRLPAALRQVTRKYGAFPINTRPLCLTYPDLITADVDGIYIASKDEVANWATKHGYAVDYPCGTAGEFAQQAFMVLAKS